MTVELLLKEAFLNSEEPKAIIDKTRVPVIANPAFLKLFDKVNSEAQLADNELYAKLSGIIAGNVDNEEKELNLNGEFYSPSVVELGKNTQYKLVTLNPRTAESITGQRNFLSAILDMIPHQVFIKDEKSNFIYANKAVANIHHKRVSEIIGKSDLDLCRSQDEAEFFRLVEIEVIKNKKEVEIPFEVQTDYKGDTHYHHVFKKPFELATGHTGIMGISLDITENFEAQRKLENSTQRLERLISNLNSGILLEDENRQILSINTEFCHLFNIPVSPQQLIGSDCSQSAEQSKHLFRHPDIFIQKTEAVLQKKEKVLNEEWEMADGRILERDYIPVFSRGMYMGHLWIYKDITEQKKKKQKVKRLKTFFEKILNELPAQVAVFDSKFNYRFVNKASIQNNHLREWIIGKNDLQYCEYMNRPQSVGLKRQECLKSVIDTKAVSQFEEELITPTGEKKHFLRAMSPVLDDKNNVSLILAYGIDITTRKHSEQRLAESRKELITVFNTVDQGIFTADETGRIIITNKKLSTIFGYQFKELDGKRINEIILCKKADGQFDIAEITEFLNGESTQTEMIGVKKNGETFPIMFHSKITRLENSSIFSVAIRDITTDKLKEEHLINSKLVAEETGKAKELFLSTMSHEIRTPLNGIVGLTEILLDSAPREDQQELLHGVKFSSEHLMSLINDILDFTKIEANKIEFEKIPFEPLPLLKNIFKTMKPRADEKGITLQYDVSDDLPEALIGDPTRVKQIIMNLAGNAIKFTEKGKVNIHFSIPHSGNEKSGILITVQDTGIGIKADKLHSIFEGFSQASSEITRKFGGTGLGLSITKKLTEMQGGTIRVQSKPGKGSTFAVFLPYKPTTAHEAKKFTTTEEPVLFEDLEILIAEDNAMNRTVISKFMEQWNISYEMAENGKIAVEKCRTKKYDLIFMDLEMPVMDGYTAAHEITTLPELKKDTLIIALSASTFTSEVKTKIKKAGMSGYTGKPFQSISINKLLQNYFPDKIKTQPAAAVSKTGCPTHHKIVDLSILKDMAVGNREFMKNMIIQFQKDGNEQLQKLQLAVDALDFAGVKSIAHSFKNSLYYMGMNEWYEKLKLIENTDLPEWDDVTTTLSLLSDTLNIAYLELDTELNKIHADAH